MPTIDGEASTPVHDCAGCGDALCELSVAAAEVEDVLAGLRCEPLQHSAGEAVHKCSVLSRKPADPRSVS